MIPQAQTRTQVHTVLLGIAIGMIAIGLMIPFLFGERASDLAAVSTRPELALDGGLEAGQGQTPNSDTGSAGADDGDGPDGGPESGGAAGPAGPTGGLGPTTGGPGGIGPGGSGGQPGPGGSGPAAASETVKVGIALLDLGNVSDLGFPSVVNVEDTQAVWEHWIATLNEQGGVKGRIVDPVFKTYDPLQEDSMRQACLFFTEEHATPLVVAAGGFVGPPILCVTQEHGTPFIVAGSSGVPQTFYDQSDGLLFTTFMGSTRTVKNLVAEVQAAGGFAASDPLQTKPTVGILFDLRSGPESIARFAQQEVEALGLEVGRVSVFSADYAVAASQVPVEVSQHQAAGVDVVLNLSHTLAFTQFVQTGANQGFNPPYFNFDWNGANSDFYYSNMPASYDGNLNFTVQRSNEHLGGYPEPAVDRACLDAAEVALGREIEPGSDDYAMARECAFFILMKHALSGSSVAPGDISAALQAVGSIDLPAFGGAMFGPGRFDAGSAVRTMVFKGDCTCILPVSDFRPSRF